MYTGFYSNTKTNFNPTYKWKAFKTSKHDPHEHSQTNKKRIVAQSHDEKCTPSMTMMLYAASYNQSPNHPVQIYLQ